MCQPATADRADADPTGAERVPAGQAVALFWVYADSTPVW